MDDKELQEYKLKIKGLTLKELNDILTHINKQKLPEKHQAIQSEISARTGVPIPAAESPVAAPALTVKHKTPTVETKSSSTPVAVPVPVSSSADASTPFPVATYPAKPWDLNIVLMAASALFIISGLYLLAIPFVNLPGASAIRSMLVK